MSTQKYPKPELSPYIQTSTKHQPNYVLKMNLASFYKK